MGSEDALRIEGLVVSPGGTEVLRGVDLTVAAGEVVAVLGASGSGKTTLLRATAGLEPVEDGHIVWDGRDVTRTPAHRRGFGLMFQDHALFPHRDVAANVAFGLRMAGMARDARDRRVVEVLDLLEIRHLSRRAVGELSGGEAQRVALGRALAPEPGLVLFDEPLSSLDRPLRDRLVGDLRAVLADLRQTALYVTHDFDEAAAIADRVAVLRAGVTARIDTPVGLRSDPGDPLTAALVGHPNVISGVGEEGGLRTPFGRITPWAGPSGPCRVVVAPGAVDLTGGGPGDLAVSTVRVHGDGYRVVVEGPTGDRLVVASSSTPPAPGDRTDITIDAGGVRLLSDPGHVDGADAPSSDP